MRTLDALDLVVGSSHQAIYRADLYTNPGVYVAELPIVRGQLDGQSRPLGRWSGTLELAGDEYAPVLASDYLSGLSQHHIRLYGGAVVGGVEHTVELARCLIGATTVQRSTAATTVLVELQSVGDYIDQSAEADWTHTSGETCQAMIKRIVAAQKPPGWPTITWTDATTGVAVPTGATWDDMPAGQVVADLSAIANVTAYIDADGNGVIRDPLPTTAGTPVRTLGVGVDAVTYQRATGRSQSFANEVQLTFSPVGASTRARLRSDWTWSASSGAPVAGQIRYTDSGSSGELRVHDRDSAGRNRQTNGLEKLDVGDIVEVRDGTGEYAVYTVTYSIDQTTYWQVGVDVLSYSTDEFLSASSVELTAYVTPVDPIIGTATQTSGVAGTTSAGRVVYRDYHVGNVTQTQANTRAAAMLEVLIRGWSTTVLQAVPDCRLEPDDDVHVIYDDGVTVAHRITDVQLPIGTTEPMSLALRTMGGL